jgi:ParB family chromosome partitioning protein
MEEATAYKNLITDFGLTQEELAQRMGRSRPYIANVMRLLALEPTVQELVSRGTLTMGQVRPLVIITDEELQIKLAYHIAENGLSARASEELVKRVLEQKDEPEKVKPKKELFLAEAEDRLKSALGTQVIIKPGKKKSKIEIEFYSEDELQRLIELLTAERKAKKVQREFHV